MWGIGGTIPQTSGLRFVAKSRSTRSQDGIYYHVWFPTKRHRRILLGEVEEKVLELFRQIAEEKGYDLIACEAMVDHAHLPLRLSPEQDLSTAIKMFKGISARRVFQAFPNLKIDIGLNNLGEEVWLKDDPA